MDPGVKVSELCRREGIQPTQYHAWKKQLLVSAEAIFGDRKKRRTEERKEARHQEQLRQKDAVIAEITAENLQFKKHARIRRLRSASRRASRASGDGGGPGEVTQPDADRYVFEALGRKTFDLLPLEEGGALATREKRTRCTGASLRGIARGEAGSGQLRA